MKKNLLEIVQDILSELDSDQVSSINDTVEAQQVAIIVKNCYNEMISNRNWPHLKKMIQLDAVNDLSKPNYLRLPDETKELLYVSYDISKPGDTNLNYRRIPFKHNDEFLRMVNMRNSSQDNVQTVIDFSGTPLLVLNDRAPQFWTSFDDLHIVFDNYDSNLDDTLKQSKNQCVAYMEPTWVQSDTAIPDLPSEAFSALEEEAKSVAFLTLKQMVNSKAEQKSARQQRWLSRKAWRAQGGVRYDDFGRKGRK